jgi:hypothetical protein
VGYEELSLYASGAHTSVSQETKIAQTHFSKIANIARLQNSKGRSHLLYVFAQNAKFFFRPRTLLLHGTWKAPSTNPIPKQIRRQRQPQPIAKEQNSLYTLTFQKNHLDVGIGLLDCS